MYQVEQDKIAILEHRIITKLVKDAIALGYTVSLNDGEVWTVKRSSDPLVVMAAIATTEQDTLRFRAKGDMGNLNAGDFIGDVTLVYGNDGHDVIADHSDNSFMRILISGASELADKLAA